MQKILLSVLLMLLSAAATAQKLVIDIDGVARPTPVAIVPFGWEGAPSAAPLQIADIVSSDLLRSGRFDPLAADRMLEKPTYGARVNFDNWRILGIEAIAIGSIVSKDASNYTIRFQVFDTVRGRELLSWNMNSPKNNLRGAAHRVADMVYEKLTGIEGVFSTRVAYVTADDRPDGRWYSLFVADQDGENDHRIIESRDPLMSPAWSPDSRQIAYVSFRNNRSAVVVQNLRSGNWREVSNAPGVNGAPAFSPDGRKLVLTLGGTNGNLDIYTMDLRTRQTTRLTTHRAIDTEGTWSPDGRWIYFNSDRSGGPQIYRIPASGGTPERVTFEGSYNARPRLSPDGKKLAMLHNDRGNYRIAVMDLESGALLVLSRGRQDESPSFAPNSDILIYATRNSGDGVLETVSADGLIRKKMDVGTRATFESLYGPRFRVINGFYIK